MKSRSIFRSLCLTVLCLLAFSSPARADETSETRAQRLFDEGRSLLEAGRSREACAKFEERQRLDPGDGTLLNLALCYENTGRFVAALSAFREALGRSVQQGRTDRERIARGHIASVEPRVATILVGTGAGRTRVDGLLVAVEPGGRLLVDPGVHVIELAPGRAQTLSLAEGETRQLDVPTTPTPMPMPSDNLPSTSYTTSYNALPVIAFVVSIVGATVATIGIIRLSRDDDAGLPMTLGGGIAFIGGGLGAMLLPLKEVKPRANVTLSGAVIRF